MEKKPSLHVLLIDDNYDDVLLIAMQLQKDYRIVWRQVDTEAQLMIALNDRWDIVLCDYKLPRFSARAALEIVRSSDPELPFVIISGQVKEEEVIEMMKQGAHDFISKDSPGRLSLAIEREVARREERDSERMRANIRIEISYERTIEAWGKALELRDNHTEGHTVRVTDLALRLAHHLKVPHSDFKNLHRGGLLHDIGKMGIPDAVLLKPGPLDEDERRIMQMHPRLAYDMLKDIPFLAEAAIIPLCHHERWDGNGYPQGLRGTDIPYLARLFSVVDVFEALTSTRPYRKAWEKAEAIYYIESERGTLFDPSIVDSFVEMIGRG